jgi:hypothetical protein
MHSGLPRDLDKMQGRANPIIRIAACNELLQRGCVNLIGLGEIKAEVGPRWEKVGASVLAKLESLLHQKLSPTDFYTQVDDMSFLVSMPSATREESQVFCLRVAHELRVSLLGSCEIGRLRISRVTDVRNDVLASAPITGLQLAALAKTARLDEEVRRAAPNQKTVSGIGSGAKRVFCHKFTPIWDAQQEAVTTYRCISAEPDASCAASPDVQAMLDLAVTLARIVTATEILGKHLESGQRFLMWIPIAFNVLTSPVGRMEIAGVCRNLSSDLRPYLTFEVSDIPFGVPQSRLSELVGSLRPFCRGVAAHLPARIPNYGAYLGAGLQAIGLSFSGSGVNGTEMGSELFKLSLAAKGQRIKSFVFDVPHHDLVRSSRDLGINHLSSPLVGEALNAPMLVKRLPMRDIPMTISLPKVAA